MSGPKTSHISIQEQIRQALSVANGLVSFAIADIEDSLNRQYDNLRSLIQSNANPSASVQSQVLMKSANSNLNFAKESLDALKLKAKEMRSLSSIEEINALAQNISEKARAIQKEMSASFATCQQEVKDALHRAERNTKASDYVKKLHSAISEFQDTHAFGFSVEQDSQNSVLQSSDDAMITWDDIAEKLEDVIARYTQLMLHPEYLTTENMSILIQQGAQLYKAIESCDESDQASLIIVSNHINLISELLPSYERDADSLRRIVSQIFALRSVTSEASMLPPSAFRSLDDAERYLDQVKSEAQASADQAYMQACIDEVMKKHGYDIARSVTLGKSAGENIIFGAENTSNGIHVFFSDSGDVMMEVVGLTDIEEVADASPIQLSRIDDGEQAHYLLELQEEFCSVYSEIEADLAEYGIHLNTYNRCIPDIRYSKELTINSENNEAISAQPSKNLGMNNGSKHRRSRGSLKERAI